MKKKTLGVLVIATTITALGLIPASKVFADDKITDTPAATYDIMSVGRVEAMDMYFDAADFVALKNAIEKGNKVSYESGYAKGYAEGFSKATVTASVTYTYHHHDTGKGEPTEVSFTGEEVENGTKDAWFAAHPVPEKVSSPIGCYTKQNTHEETYISGYNHHHDPVGNGTWECVDPEIGSYNWTGSWHDWDEPIYAKRTVSDGYVPNCGKNEGELLRVLIELD